MTQFVLRACAACFALLLLFVLPACSGGDGTPGQDAGADQGQTPDGGGQTPDSAVLPDTGPEDAGPDTGPEDVGVDAGPECVSAAECDDANVCTDDSCGVTGVCEHTPVTTALGCDDGDACTQTDTCVGEVCTGADPVVCLALDQCHDVGTCDPGTGLCSDPALDDNTDCDDADACTQADTCQGGVCTGADLVVCTALDSCHEIGVCDGATGVCSDPVLTDGSLCETDGMCVLGMCVLPPVTLALQDFELSPAAPAWSYTGTPVFVEGFSSATAGPPNSALGVDGSRAWHTVQVSGGQVLTFDNVTVPAGFVRVRLRMRVAAMNLNGSMGGPDNLDYVLVQLSTDGGMTYYARVRLRGASTNDSFWGYEGTGVALVDSLPATEELFQRMPSGYLADGYSTVEVVFPGDVGQVGVQITARSSSSGDSWLIDNVELLGEYE